MARNQSELGLVREVLVEGPARRGGGMLCGKTPQFKTAVFPAQARPGDTIPVRIVSATSHSLTGVPASVEDNKSLSAQDDGR